MLEHGKLSILSLADGSESITLAPRDGVYETPTTWGDLMYVPCWDSNMRAFHLADWTEAWSVQVTPKYKVTKLGDRGLGAPSWIITTPAVTDHGAFFGSQSGYVSALRPLTGEVLWNRRISRCVSSPPLAKDGVLYVASFDSTFWALDVRDGSKLWSVWLGEPVEYGGPQSRGGDVFVSGTRGSVFAIDVANRTLRWQQKIGCRFRTPVAVGDSLLCVADSTGIHGLNPISGRIRWTVPVNAQGPSIVEGDVFCVGRDSVLRHIDGDTGEVLDRFEMAGESSLRCRPTYAEGRLLVADGRWLYCLKPALQ
jgi:outer membrane protein assembly factor BamB